VPAAIVIVLDQLEPANHLVCRAYQRERVVFPCNVRAFDLRQGSGTYHFNNGDEWLNFRCGSHLADGGGTNFDNPV
jgi:hypothetical protein